MRVLATAAINKKGENGGLELITGGKLRDGPDSKYKSGEREAVLGGWGIR